MKKPNINIPKPKKTEKEKAPADSGAKRRTRETNRVERSDESRLLFMSIIAILIYILIAWTLVAFFSESHTVSLPEIVKGSMGSVFALLFAVLIMDTISRRSSLKKRKREERKAIVRHNKIIQPVIDMYLVRKNMVITPTDKTVRKFRVTAAFTIKDMKDMYGPSELISDVGKSKIQMYSFYQDKLLEMFTHLVEDINFNFYSDLCDAAMKYINATSYGASALEAVLSYQDTMSGTKSMRSVVLNMIREEPENGKFIDAQPALKNVYLVHQMITEQETALSEYLKIVRAIIDEDINELKGKKTALEVDYE